MKRSPGRPRSRPENLVVFNALLTEEAKDRLKALSQLEGTYAYTILEQAFWERWKSLPSGRREAAEMIASAIESARAEARNASRERSRRRAAEAASPSDSANPRHGADRGSSHDGTV